jgi:hypothetical protein
MAKDPTPKRNVFNPPMPAASEKSPVAFRSRYGNLRITFKHGDRLDNLSKQRSQASYVQFQNEILVTSDPDVVKFLFERKIDGHRAYGVDYWLEEDTGAFIKQLPKKKQKDTLIKAQGDTIARLQAEIETLRSGKVA